MQRLPVTVRGVPAYVKPGSIPGTYNLWPASGGRALEIRLTSAQVARRFPDHAQVILARRESSD